MSLVVLCSRNGFPPFPRAARECLIKTFCPAALQDSVRANPGDEDCLVRPYLGRRRRSANSRSRFQRFSLPNYPLHIDQMEHLRLDIAGYARAMGAALAMMHWGARIDANDVEFVLAPARPGDPSTHVFHSDALGDHIMWILDFDCCRALALDEKGVEQVCTAFFRNDPFYPRLDNLEYTNDDGGVNTWHAFRDAFLMSSREILDRGDLWLAERLMVRIEEVGLEKRKAKAEM